MLLAIEQRVLEKCNLERLKGRRELGIKVDVAPQVPRQAQVVLQSSQGFRIAQELYCLVLLL